MGKPGKSGTNNKSNPDDERNYYNILFLGQTGVGKSTFINAFVNYLGNESLKKAKSSAPIILIDCQFVLHDEDLTERKVVVRGTAGTSEESQIVGDSATQKSNIYTFPLLGTKNVLRLIDTPGIADTRGIEQDQKNCEDILLKISQYEEIHAICILLKPNEARITAQFEFSIKEILKRLDKSAANNIIFVFTNSRATSYKPGDTLPALKSLLKSISERAPYVNIPLKKENIFCLDNEAFRFLLKMEHVNFSEDEVASFEKSWDISRKVCLNMMSYICGDETHPGLVPHQTRNTMSINESRRIIMQLTQPLADITNLICDKVYALEHHTRKLQTDNQSLEQLKQSLYVPLVDIDVTPFDKPRTVCADKKCTSQYTVQGKTKCHYLQLCHNPCYLSGVPSEVIGAAELLNCAAMGGTAYCKKCNCHYSKHMHIYYETKLCETRIEDSNVVSQITDHVSALKEVESLIQEMQKIKEQLENEHEFILNITAQFACFLRKNAITPYNDAYSTYVNYLIEREQSLGDRADEYTIKKLRSALQKYEEYKQVLDKPELNIPENSDPFDTDHRLKQLFRLKHLGKKIELLFKCQDRAHEAETQNCEYVHHAGLDLSKQNKSTDQNINEEKRNTNTQNRNTAKNQNKPWNNNKKQHNEGGNRNYQRGQNQKWPNQQQNRYQRQKPQPPQNFQQSNWQQPYNYQQMPPSPNYYNPPPQGPPPLLQPNLFSPQNPWQNQPPQNTWQNQPPQNTWQNQPPQNTWQNQPPQNTWQNQPPQNPWQNQSPQQGQQQSTARRNQHQKQPPNRNSNTDKAACSKSPANDTPTGKYVPKPKNPEQGDRKEAAVQSLEHKYSSLALTDGTTGVYNKTKNQDQKARNRTQRRPRKKQHLNNVSNKDSEDDEEDLIDFEVVKVKQSPRKIQKDALIKRSFLATFEQSLSLSEGRQENANQIVSNNAIEGATNFFRQLFK